MNPSDLLEELKSGSSEKICSTLESIYSICDDMRRQGVTKFTVAAVSKYGEGRGVPKAQSMRNKTGGKYRALIESFNKRGVSKSNRVGNASSWMYEISDPACRAMVLHQAAQLKKANETIQKLQPISEPIVILDNVNSLSVERLTDLEREALEYLLSDEFISKMRVKTGEHGDYLDSEGKRMFKIATIDAISKCIRVLG